MLAISLSSSAHISLITASLSESSASPVDMIVEGMNTYGVNHKVSLLDTLCCFALTPNAREFGVRSLLIASYGPRATVICFLYNFTLIRARDN